MARGEIHAPRAMRHGQTEVRLGLLGCGTVGRGFVSLLHRQQAAVDAQVGARVRLVRVATRSLRRVRGAPFKPSIMVTDPQRITRADDVDIVVELIGGCHPAKRLVMEAIESGKTVVTANKAMLAEHGEEIFSVAAAHRVHVGFEASVGGGIPIIAALSRLAQVDRIRRVHGVVNATCNYVLSMLAGDTMTAADALRLAQAHGIAETDPRLDIDGTDSAHKLCILAALAFGVSFRPDAIEVQGIHGVDQIDVASAGELGYAVRLLAVAIRSGSTVSARVGPALIPHSHPLAQLRGALNAICVEGDALGTIVFSGPGAGMMATATAVLSDVVRLARARVCGDREPAQSARIRASGGPAPRRCTVTTVAPDARYYMRLTADDRPGVLGDVTRVLALRGISIAAASQRRTGTTADVPIVIVTHATSASQLRAASDRIGEIAGIRRAPLCLPIVDTP